MATNFIGVLLSNSPNYTVNSGFATKLYDAAGAQTITVQSGASLSLIGTMGGNTIQLAGDSSSWQVMRDGSTAVFIHSDGSRIEIPAITEAQTILFDDFEADLLIDVSSSAPMVIFGEQALGATTALIDTTGGTGQVDPTNPDPPVEPTGAQTPWTLVMASSYSPYSSQGSLFVSDGTASGTQSSTIDIANNYYSSNYSLIFATTPDQTAVYYYTDSYDFNFGDFPSYLGYTDGSVTAPVNLATGEVFPYFVSVTNEQLVIAGKNTVIVSDGTAGGTAEYTSNYLIPGYNAIHDADNQKLWFSDSTPPYGRELILFDYSSGSNYSTVMIKDIWPGSNSGVYYIDPYTAALLPDGRLVFHASDDVHGGEPWVSDGTEAGTFMLTDLYFGWSSAPSQFTAFNDTVVFMASVNNSDLGGYGRELVVTDGTSDGTTVLDIHPGSSSSDPVILGQVGGLLYFTAEDADGKGIFSTNGSDFTKLATINNAASLLAWNPETAFFRVSTTEAGDELWAADLTGTIPAADSFYLVKDILPGSGSGFSSSEFVGSGLPNVLEVGNSIAFNAYTSATEQGLFISDGTEAGTIQLSTSLSNQRVVLGDFLIFATNDLIAAFDTTANQTSATELITGFSLGENNIQNDADQAFLLLDNNELHVTDGTTSGTVKLAGSVADFKVLAEDALFFVQNSQTSGKSLWYSDGTTEGTRFIEALPDEFYYNMDSAVGIKTEGLWDFGA